jgi:hypothetical protein
MEKIRHPERSRPKGGAVEGPFLLVLQEERSLHCASLRSAPVGMTALFAKCDCHAAQGEAR